jgi:hypothetical protein
MTSVIFPPALGGDGSTVSDDADPTTGLRNAGYKTRFVPALQQTVNIVQTAVEKAAAAAASEAVVVTKAAEARASELAAAGFANAAQQTTLGFATNRPKIRPSLNLDFVNQEVVDSRIVVNRAGPKSYFGNRKVLGDENLVRFSEQFDNGAWTKATMTITANAAIAPDGQTTADQAQHSSAAGQTAQAITGTANAPYVFSMFVKESIAGFVRVTVGNLGGAYFGGWFNTTTGAWATTDAGAGGTFTSAAVVAYPNGWYRISIVGSNNATNYNTSFYLTAADNTSVRSTTPVIFTWGAQLEQRSTLTAYTRTIDYPVRTFFTALETAAANVMPIEYDPVTEECLGIKPESAATNLLLQSGAIGTTPWSFTNATASQAEKVAPNGLLQGVKLTSVGTGARARQTVTLTAGVTYIASYWLMSTATVTLVRTTIGSASINHTDLVNANLGKWVRVTAVFVAETTGSNTLDLARDFGAAGAEIFIWGAQLEASTLGVPSSYIPTTTAQVTRLADNPTVPVSEFEYNQNEGTLYAEVNTPVAVDSGLNEFILSLNSGNATNRIPIYRQSAGALDRRLSAEISNQNITQAQLVTATQVFTSNAVHRLSFSFARNNVIGYFDNVSLGSDLTAEIPSNITNLDIGSELGGSVFNGYIRSLAYYPKALSALEAQALSQV